MFKIHLKIYILSGFQHFSFFKNNLLLKLNTWKCNLNTPLVNAQVKRKLCSRLKVVQLAVKWELERPFVDLGEKGSSGFDGWTSGKSDHVDWDFLDRLLMKKGFGYKWRMWIWWCIRNMKNSILINVAPKGLIQASRG